MQVKRAIKAFLDYLLIEKGLSNNTFESYNNDLQEFYNFLINNNIQNIEDINKEMILEYYDILDKKEYSKATLQRRYSSLNQLFKYLIRQEKIKTNPILSMRRTKKNLTLPKYLTEEQMNKFLSANNPNIDFLHLKHRLILEILYSTGMRVSEICNLPLNSVYFLNDKNTNIMNKDIENYTFITIKGKGQKERIVPIRANVIQLLKQYLSIKKSKKQKYLFPSAKNIEKPMTRQRIWQIIKDTAILAGLNPEHITPHTIRHSFATHLLQKGLDIREIQELLGHSSIDTTSIYAKINVKSNVEVVEKYHPLSNKFQKS